MIPYNKMISYSQEVNGHRADVTLINNYINNPNVNGVFLEIGGFDGITYSNTYALEKYFNFTGILIEPSPLSFKKMIKNRPKCLNINCAISNNLKEIEFVGDGTAVGGAKNVLDTMVKNGKNWSSAWNLKNETVKIKAMKLGDILNKAQIKYIDFFSLDVEGSELEVLESMEWKIPVYIIVMEVKSWINEEKVEKCRNILRKNGFTCDGKLYGIDEWWINEKYFRKKLLKKVKKS